MAFRTEGLWADWGRQVGERPMPAEHGAAAGPGAGQKAALGFTGYPLTSGWPRGEQEPQPRNVYCLGKATLEGTSSHRCPASGRNCGLLKGNTVGIVTTVPY